MKNLLYKELKLVVMLPTYFFLLLNAMMLIPQYPYCVGPSYCVLGIFIAFNTASMNKDHEFMAALPIARRDIVGAKHLTVIFIELMQVLTAIPFALLSQYLFRSGIYPNGGNIVGMDANAAFFGMILLAFSAFNLIFLPWYFKTGYKTGVPMAFALLGYLAVVGVFEFTVAFTPLKTIIDGSSESGLIYRVLVLVIGIIAFAFSGYASYRISDKNFERVSL